MARWESPTRDRWKASVTFTDYRQYVDAIVGPRPSLSLVGKTSTRA